MSLVRLLSSPFFLLVGLCAFVSLINFKPSDPYLSDYLICDANTEKESCSHYTNMNSCNRDSPCSWTGSKCSIQSCSGNSNCSELSYCQLEKGYCEYIRCYEHFTEDQVNNEIYPWSTYAYLPFLVILGIIAELYSYRFAILFGIGGRIATRFLLLFGNSLIEMQMMQMTYSLGTAAEDIFVAYIFYIVPQEMYLTTTSYVKACALFSCVISGILADLLVVEKNDSLKVLMRITAFSVCLGFIVGIVVLRRNVDNNKDSVATNSNIDHKDVIVFETSAIHRDSSSQHSKNDLVNDDNNGSNTSNLTITIPQNHADSNVINNHSPFGLFTHSKSIISSSCDSLQQQQHHQHSSTTAYTYSPVNTANPDEEKFVNSFNSNTYDNDSTERNHNTSNRTSEDETNKKHRRIDRIKHFLIYNQVEKFKLFKKQLLFFYYAIQNPKLKGFLCFWITGNAVYSILYNYEVSIYEELNGSNEWNGSVLAVMLLSGTAGALLPPWLQPEVPLINLKNTSHVQIQLCIVSIISVFSLLFFVKLWETTGSIALLSLFFACWQYINVTCITQLAKHMKYVQFMKNYHRLTYSYLNNSIESMLMTSRSAGNTHGDLLINNSNNSNLDELQYHLLVSGMNAKNNKQLQQNLDNSESESEDNNNNNNNNNLNYVFFGGGNNNKSNSNNDTKHESKQEDNSKSDQLPPSFDPPYSVAIVTIVALNVIVQIILQGIVFSWLEVQFKFLNLPQRMQHISTTSIIKTEKKSLALKSRLISLYYEPPQQELTLDEFEMLSLDRLQLLRGVDLLKAKGFDNKDFTSKVYELEKKYMVGKKDSRLSESKRDQISHFILRLAYCRTEDLRRWFLNQECALLKARLDWLSDSERSDFMAENGLDFEQVPNEEKSARVEYLCGLADVTPSTFSSTSFYKIPFQQALSLIANRSIYLERGQAYVPVTKLVSIIVTRFRMNLSRALVDAANSFDFVSSDTRIGPLLKNMNKQFIGNDFGNRTQAIDKLTPEKIDVAADLNMPLCMKHLHNTLKKDHKLKHWGRLQYGLFLKGAGLDLEGAMMFWERMFTMGSVNHDQFVKQYSYNFRHMYGKEGARKNYTPYSCMKIIMGPPPEANAAHGCPYRHSSDKELVKMLGDLKISGPDVNSIVELAKTSNYQLACQRHFDITHPGHMNMDLKITDSVANHPNQWFHASTNYHKIKNGQAAQSLDANSVNTPNSAAFTSIEDVGNNNNENAMDVSIDGN